MVGGTHMSAIDGIAVELPRLDPVKQAMFGPPGAVADQTFELGLVLGGTVSAGAYTAGALDLLVQALDAFQMETDPPAQHKVILRLAAGTSGGAVCSAILGLSLNRQFTHIVDNQTALNTNGAGPADNKFWDLWVNNLSFLPMLDTGDLANPIQDPADPPGSDLPPVQHVPALLNGKVIDDAVALVVAYAGQRGNTIRPWAVAPFRLATTVCNLRGVPYTIAGAPAIGPFTGTAYVEHDDYAWFALPNVRGTDDGDIGSRRPNEFWLSAAPQPGISFPYQTLGDYARASGAMPLGLPSRPLSRPAEHYLYRPYARVDDAGVVQTAWPSPDWSELTDVLAGQPYSFTGVDGGTLNNDPVKIAHEALSGIGVHNPRAANQANRALLLIDPLADEPTTVNPIGLSIVAAAKALISTLVGGARYLTADLDLFQAQDVFSRFQLVPTRTGLDGRALPGDAAPRDKNGNPPVGEAALAGTDLFALGGWCARPFRVHDFLLGRLNMAAYLRRELILRGDNSLFNNWSLGKINDYSLQQNGDRLTTAVTPETPKATYFLPVIPMPADNFGVTPPTWPNGALDPSSLQQPIKARAEAVLGALRADNLPGFVGWLVALVALGGVADTIANDIVAALTKTLADRNLWPLTGAGVAAAAAGEA
jgi:hypothetical protein